MRSVLARPGGGGGCVKSYLENRGVGKQEKREESELEAEGVKQMQVVVIKRERHGKCKRETTE